MNTSTRVAVIPALALGLATGAWAAGTPYQGDGHILLDPAELEWGEIGSMAGDARIAVVEGNLGEEEPFTFRLRLPPDYEIRPHIHPAYERVTVLSGTLHFAHGEEFDRDTATELPAGAVAIMAPGEPMYGFTGTEETVIQLHGTGPWGIEYLDPADDPRN
ncbi:DUF4437 domain-containing protein [Arhodomonas sp. SL1]|uniref:cupin domain-containing protein n=1 Tax=Arhodomonas sp. SL1 TaxID=3425691 RepID=UPI003F883DD5